MTTAESRSEIADLKHEIGLLQAHIDKHDSLIGNGPETIRVLMAECDDWRTAVTALCRIANITLNQLTEAGLCFHIAIEGKDD
jgi:hypothetical protein